MRTFRHRHPVTTVAMSTTMCISGCERGRVKVWNLKTGELIKVKLLDIIEIPYLPYIFSSTGLSKRCRVCDQGLHCFFSYISR